MLNLLTPLAALLGLEVGELADRARKHGILWGAIGLFALIALTFCLAAANTALTVWVGPIWAPLIIAGIAALVALGIYLVSRITADIEHRRRVDRRRSAETTALVATAAVTALPVLMKSPLMKSIGLPLGGALAALFLLSKSGPGSGKNGDN